MYTQCPDCTTVFRVSADVLRTAQGQVRCGVCAHSFNALENLSEEPFKAAEPEQVPQPDDSMTVEELPGSEEIELSSASELPALPEPPPAAPPQPPAPPQAAAPPKASAPPPAAAPVPAPPADEMATLEFHGDAAELDRVFVTANEAIKELAPAEDLERTDEYPILVLDERDEPEAPQGGDVVPESPAERAPSAPETATSAYTAPRILIPEEMRQRLAEEAAAHEADSTGFGLEQPATGERRWPWMAAAAALLVLFAAQVVHGERQALVQKPGIGPFLAQTYELLGQPLTAPTDLSAYELRQWGAASDPAQPGRLLLRASIVNRAAFAQPFPLLRLALQDRFGAALGVRDIEPADYLPGETPSKLLGPGERADAEIRIVDPGQEAVGFEMDVCLSADGGVHCASQVTAAAQ